MPTMAERDTGAATALDELELIYRTAPVGLCLVDRELRFVRINEQLAAINGRPVQEHIGKTVRDIIPKIVTFFLEEEAKGRFGELRHAAFGVIYIS